MKRGDIVTVALQGDLGKPRPAVIVESDRIAPTDFVLVCPATSHVLEEVRLRRILVEPTAENGLLQRSQFQVDKMTVVRREKCGPVIGALTPDAIERLNGNLFVVLGLADHLASTP